LALVENETQEGDLSATSESPRVTPSTSSSLSSEDSALKNVTGDRRLTDVDAVVVRGDRGLTASMDADDASEGPTGGRDTSWGADSTTEQSRHPNPYTRDAVQGDWDLDAPVDRGQDVYVRRVYTDKTRLATLMLADDDKYDGLLINGEDEQSSAFDAY
jgi:hypothetical protein